MARVTKLNEPDGAWDIVPYGGTAPGSVITFVSLRGPEPSKLLNAMVSFTICMRELPADSDQPDQWVGPVLRFSKDALTVPG